MSWFGSISPVYEPIRVLGLEEEFVQRRAAAAKACATYYRASHQPDLRAATMSVLDASCGVLMDSHASQPLWQVAYGLYADLGHPYADLLAVCAGLTDFEYSLSRPPRTALALLCRLIALAWLTVATPRSGNNYGEELENLGPLVTSMGAPCPGQLGLPLHHVNQFASILSTDWLESGFTRRTAATAEHLLRRAADTVRAAQEDHYHWRRILPGFMPVEPEWLALGRIIHESLIRARVNLAEGSLPALDPLELLPLVIARRMPPPTQGIGQPASPGPVDGQDQSPFQTERRTGTATSSSDNE